MFGQWGVTRLISMLAAAAVVSGVGLATAPSASAFPDATYSVTFSCTFDVHELTVMRGDTINVTFDSGCAEGQFGRNPLLVNSPDSGNRRHYTVLPGAPYGASQPAVMATINSVYVAVLYLTLIEPSSGMPDQLQQVGVPKDGTCANVPDADLTWGTDLTGGWVISWAEWAHGPVCTRTFHYSTDLGRWVLL